MSTTSRPSSGDPRPGVRIEAAGSSPDEAMALLPGIHAGKRWTSAATDRPYGFRYLAVGDERLTMRRSEMQGSVRGEVHIGGDYVVHWLTSGSLVLDTLGDPSPLPWLRPNLSPEGERFVFEAVDYDVRLVHLNRALVHDVAAERTGSEVSALRPLARSTADLDALARWRGALSDASAVIALRDEVPLAWHEATRAVAAAFLSLWPPHVRDAPPALLYPRNARIRAAVEFVHAHVAQPLTVARIAGAAGLGIRATQEGFQRVLGVSPMTYVLDLRLERVRADLLAGDPGDVTVTAVARRWGFVNVGRFAGTYRARFGELPSETLRR